MRCFPTIPARAALPPCSHPKTVAVYDHRAYPVVVNLCTRWSSPLGDLCMICNEFLPKDWLAEIESHMGPPFSS